jgi:hypothetical protein
MMTSWHLPAALSLSLVLAACSSGSGGASSKSEGGVSGCQPVAGGLGAMSWLDDGTQECAVGTSATFVNTSIYTMFSLSGSTTTLGVGLGVSTVLGPGPIGGSYSCAPLDSVSVTFNYTQGQTSTAATSCQLTLNMQGTAGVHATGTFAATLMTAGGGTKSISDGVFDVPVGGS